MHLSHALVGLALAASMGTASAAVVLYDFKPINFEYFSPTITPDHLQASSVAITLPWVCLTDAGPADFRCGGTGNAMVSFSVSAEAGWRFDVKGFHFQGFGVDANGPTDFAVYSSLDGFLNPLLSGGLSGSTLGVAVDYDVPVTAQGLTGPFELRIVSTAQSGGSATAWLLDNLRLEVEVSRAASVPEPGTALLAGLALWGLARTRRRSRA